jgi:hypothetical protein
MHENKEIKTEQQLHKINVTDEEDGLNKHIYYYKEQKVLIEIGTHRHYLHGKCSL